MTSSMTPADFLKAPMPDPVEVEGDLTGPARFFNRELSWLGFNWRVLEEAENPRVPLLERLRFLSISATNLDEFFTVRVAGLRELANAGNTTPAADGLSPAGQLVLINADARKLMERQQSVFQQIRSEMEQAGIHIMAPDALNDADKAFLTDHFLNNVFPVLSPLAIDPAHPFPFIPNMGYALALQLERKSDKRSLQALLPIPAQIDRFMMKVNVDYPTKDQELEVMRRISNMKFDYTVNTVLNKEDIFDIRNEINQTSISESLERYIIELVYATRDPKGYGLTEAAEYIQFGVSPRASINLNLAAKAVAYFEGRDYVLPEDIKEVALDVLNHRIILNYEAEADNVDTKDLIKTILNKIPINN